MAAVHLLGSGVLDLLGRHALARQLRVLAYHDVRDPARFEAQMGHLAANYTPVSAVDVLAALRRHTPLPNRSVWVTFDDGHPNVVRVARPILDRFGIRATVFVCPGLIDTDRPFWWEVVLAALEHGIHPRLDGWRWKHRSLVSYLWTRPDSVRRAFVGELDSALLAVTGAPLTRRQLRTAELLEWLAGGHHVGNHSWDHPSLDRCDELQQAEQVERADRWLRERLPRFEPVFAYPNGTPSAVSEETLWRLGYRIALGFDHRLARLHGPPLMMSRLMVSADADLPRFRSILSGLHSTAFAVASSQGWRRRRDAGSMKGS